MDEDGVASVLSDRLRVGSRAAVTVKPGAVHRTWFSASEWSCGKVDTALYLCLFTLIDATDVDDIMRPEIHEWCWANLGGVMFGAWFEGRYTLFFEHDFEAILFKLALSECL